MYEYLKHWLSLQQREDGVTAIEYALLVALIAIALVGGATALGVSLSNFFSAISTFINGYTARV
ncbi:Flp family type IVb pilin [Polynucleobacter sp. MG-6-Vaara-E2]|jgi:pilus assembly protein Flp/PilA|uniref:Flp family type IVb pilin n=1 Tax=Polynucleobacter sp. MG-6-Vaara-E2 TaxID=2576932 RepID=UPI001BFED648|nr:Flp family type IVb pilin [Polynucleobacter sp. MG-6-Vaara-E2]QWD96219.1 Flp family type IVb pilin [Polynucleobacter sp. MG-6-Vaara-E2]